MSDLFNRSLAGGIKFKQGRNLQSKSSKDSINQKSSDTTKTAKQKFGFFAKKTPHNDTNDQEEKKSQRSEKIDDFESDDELQPKKRQRVKNTKTNEPSISLKELQRQNDISVKGKDIPRLTGTFAEMTASGVPKYMLRNLLASVDDGGFGFDKPMPAQMQTVPTVMAKREVMLFAPTGSGKTVAFGLPMMGILDTPPETGEYSGFIEDVIKKQNTETESESESEDEDSEDDLGMGTHKTVKPESIVDSDKPVTVLPFRGIVLAPTRELAHQTFKVLKTLGEGRKWKITMLTKEAQRKVKKTLTTVEIEGEDADVDVDSEDEYDQSSAKASSADDVFEKYGIHNGDTSDPANDDIQYRNILVTTPLILMVLLEKANAIMPFVRMVVFDESDRLFDLGFLEQIDRIMKRCVNPRILRLLCSATITHGVEILAKSILRDPIRVVVGGRNVAQANVTQRLTYVGNEDGKALAIRQQISKGLNIPMLIFTQSKERAMQVYDEFKHDNYRFGVIHSDMTSKQRLDVMNDFRTGKLWVLVCTDLLSRGIDFKHVNCVVNFDFPQTVASYIHRIGRTGRGGRRGEAITYVTDLDKVLLHDVAHIVKDSTVAQQFGYSALKEGESEVQDINDIEIDCPAWMLEAPKASAKAVKNLAERAPVRDNVNMVNKHQRREAAAKKRKRAMYQRNKDGAVDFTSRGEAGGLKEYKNLTTEEKEMKKKRQQKKYEKKKKSRSFAAQMKN